MTIVIKDIIHAAHCCHRHGCLYRHFGGDCPVVAGEAKAAGACEACDIERETLEDLVIMTPGGFELLRADKFCEEWNAITMLGSIPLVFYYTGVVVVNTAPYTAEQLEWIAAKAKLMEVKNRG